MAASKEETPEASAERTVRPSAVNATSMIEYGCSTKGCDSGSVRESQVRVVPASSQEAMDLLSGEKDRATTEVSWPRNATRCSPTLPL